ncbi:MAG: hypothetical protein IKD76_04680 [Clostridia bacterium]|nr:hypothetical protein [Clostridia bacterium]
MNIFPIVSVIIFVVIFILVILNNFVINPMKTANAKIIKKTQGGIGNIWYITVEINGEIIELRTKYYVYMTVSEGDEGTIWYNNNYCARFSKNV